MKKIATILLGGTLLLGTVACQEYDKTDSAAPNSTQKEAEAPTEKSVKDGKDDASSKVRQNQLNSDIRSREQRNNATGGDMTRANADLSSEVRSKLEANIKEGSLTVAAKDGVVEVSGTVPTQEKLNKIEPLAKEIKGVKSVNVMAKVVAPVKQ